MSPVPPPPQPIGKVGQAPKPERAPLKLVNMAKPKLVPRIVLYAGEKFGKTTFFAYSPDPVILTGPRETGYQTLLAAGRVPSIPVVEIASRDDLLWTLDSLLKDPQGRKTIGFDAIGAFDLIFQQYVCDRDFKGDWGDAKDGFLAFGAHRGYTATAMEFGSVLQRLDDLREKYEIVSVLLGHAITKPSPNPQGPDFLTFTCDCNKHLWADIARWADVVLFGKFHTTVDVSKRDAGKALSDQTAKGIGGTTRVIYAQGRDAIVAGGRFGMTPEFSLPDDASKFWPTVWNEIVRSK